MTQQRVQRELDEVISYACIFADRAKHSLRDKMRAFNIPYNDITYFVEQEKIPENSVLVLQNFMAHTAHDQREKMLKDTKQCKELLAVLFKIVD